MGQDNQVFQWYTPFRNKLRRFGIIDTLFVLWGYSRNFTFNLPVPDDIQKPPRFRNNASIHDRRYYGIPEFEQAFLLKEIILNCSLISTKRYAFKDRNQQADLVNYMRHTLSENIDRKYHIKEDVILNFNRLFHAQFQWQFGYSKNVIYRYYRIFSYPAVDELIKSSYGMSTLELFLLGFYLFKTSGDNFRTKLPIVSETPVLTHEMIALFFHHFSCSIDDAKAQIKEHQQMNENLFYSYNPLVAKPILIYENSFLCPIPILLYWKFTSGLYYGIVNNGGFNKKFGDSFELYVGEIIIKFNIKNWEIFPEHVYGKPEKRSVDWLIESEDSLIFVECKTKRMTQPSKTHLGLSEALSNDLKIMAGYIVQLYRTYSDYQNNAYGFIQFKQEKTFVPLLLTLEPWYLDYNQSMRQLIHSHVIGFFFEIGLDVKLLETNPYQITSCQDFEIDIQLMQEIGIAKYFELQREDKLDDVTKDFKFENMINAEKFEEIFHSPFKSNH